MIVQTKRREDGYMNAVQVIEVIQNLAHSQGFYSKLLRDIKNLDAQGMRDFIDLVESKNFKEPLDVVMWLEC